MNDTASRRRTAVEEQILKAATVDRLHELLQRSNELLAEQMLLQRVAALGGDRVFEFQHEHHGIRLWLPYAASDLIQRRILSTSTFHRIGVLNRLKPRLGRGTVVCDIGAYIGSQSIFFGRCLEAAHVHAFEMLTFSCEIMRRNIELNAMGAGISIHHSAVGKKGDRAKLGSFKATNIGATTIELADDGEMVCKALDELTFDRLDFVNIDIGAGQERVLLGADATLQRHRPLVLLTLGPTDRDVVRLLEARGFKQTERIGPAEHLFAFSA